jgi:hypothetical protein
MDEARAMIKTAFVISLLIFAGCSQFGHGKADPNDKYAIAASSWKGSNILEMVAAWPRSMPSCGSKKGRASGCVWWRHQSGGRTFPYYCETVAYYDESGVITKVEVRRSDDCHRLFERHFERMTWP